MLFLVNIVGGFVIGLVVGGLAEKGNWGKTRTTLMVFALSLAFSLTSCFLFFMAKANAAEPIQVRDLLRETTLRIEGNGCLGSGFITQSKSGKHYLVTNSHVCNCARWKGNIYGSYDSGELLVGKVVKQDWGPDLCAAIITKDNPSLHLGRVVLPFMEVSTRGYPGGRASESHGMIRGTIDWEYSMGIGELGKCPKSSRSEYGYSGLLEACTFHYTSVVTNLYARPGASGSPVVNDSGELVGVVSSWNPQAEDEGGIVPFGQLKKFLDNL